MMGEFLVFAVGLVIIIGMLVMCIRGIQGK